MAENQKALMTIVTVLTSIQEEVTSLATVLQKQQSSTIQIHPHRNNCLSSSQSAASTNGICLHWRGIDRSEEVVGTEAGEPLEGGQGDAGFQKRFHVALDKWMTLRYLVRRP